MVERVDKEQIPPSGKGLNENGWDMMMMMTNMMMMMMKERRKRRTVFFNFSNSLLS